MKTHFNKSLSRYERYFERLQVLLPSGRSNRTTLITPERFPTASEVPEALLFVILKEPVSYAYSTYKLLHKEFKHKNFLQACQQSDYLLRLSCYAEASVFVFRSLRKGAGAIFIKT